VTLDVIYVRNYLGTCKTYGQNNGIGHKTYASFYFKTFVRNTLLSGKYVASYC
jgi:hypothetical protein